MTLRITGTEYINDYGGFWYDGGYIECDFCGRCTDETGADFWPDITQGWAFLLLAGMHECPECVNRHLADAQ